MKNTNKRSIVKLVSVVLTLALVFSTTTNVFAAWESYNSSNGGGYYATSNNVSLQETWIGGKQCINYYQNGQWQRNIASEGHTLWLNSQEVLWSLYDTCYWCFDQYGNCFAIDTSRRLLLLKAGTTSFVIENTVSGCTGFQRDAGKVGYLLYTDYGNYNLLDLLNGTYNGNSSYNYNYNYNNNYNSYSSYSGSDSVTQRDNIYYYRNGYNEYQYSFMGTQLKLNNTTIASNVAEIAFAQGYLLYVTTSKQVYKVPVGSNSRGTQIATNFFCFDDYDGDGWIDNITSSGNKKTSVNGGNNNYYYYDDYYYNDDYYDEYPYVKKSGSTYYYYTSSSKYYKYSMSGSTLYYKGTNSSSSSTSLASSVDEITFCDGYVVYSTTSGYVYAYPIGKTGSSNKTQVGTKFKYFDEEDDYWSYGYYNTSNNLVDFDDELDIDRYSYDRNYYGDYDFYVEKSGGYYYYYPNSDSSKYYKYYLSGSTLYYKGTNSSSSSTSLATSVDEITFTEDYIVYALTSGKVYKMEIGKTTTSYREYVGDDFNYFDEEDDYVSFGYYDEDDYYIDF